MRLNFAARNRGWHSGVAATTRGASAQRITEVSSKPSEPRSHNALSMSRLSGGKPVIEQDFRINLAVPGIGLGFVQDRGEVI